jgi:hypothetical protein
METTQSYADPTSFEAIRAILKEVSESQKETDRIIKETSESQKETDRITRENAKLIGKLGGRLGDMAEHLVAPNLAEKFSELGVVFEKAYQNTRIKDKKNNIFAQADITLENSDKVMIVEVKFKLTTEDITEHIERIGKMRTHAYLHGDKRKFLGAIAGMVMTDNERAFALKNGFYLIEPSGETFTITPPNGQPKEW